MLRVRLLVGVLALSGIAAGQDCTRLKSLPSVASAQVLSTGEFPLADGRTLSGLPKFCRVEATLTPSPDSAIRVELWLPLHSWNERLLGTGNGGLAGNIAYPSLASGLKSGYAVANTDMGMATPSGKDASIFINRPERWADWGWRSTHEMTVFAKDVIRSFYGRAEKKDYFSGCSTGGEQGLMEAQRFPDDYDGIVSGAPAHNRTGVHEDILWNFAAVEHTPESYLPTATLKLLTDAVVKACDLNDGIHDGLIGDPRLCNFDPAVLLCKAGANSSCLSTAQVETARKIYDGPSDPRTGNSLYPGLERGSEFAWGSLGPKPPAAKAPYSPVFEWTFGSTWDWRSFDFSKDAEAMQAKLGSTLNATDPNIDRFIDHGHKLVLYHGWSDPIVAPRETITYMEALRQRRHVDGSVRLFLLPGVTHCGGGPGPSGIDPLDAVVRWVEQAHAPATLTAKSSTTTRPLCPYPTTALYKGKGDPNDLASYTCSTVKLPLAK